MKRPLLRTQIGLLGALLNTRGLMELVVPNIGYEMGIPSPTIFTTPVLMALVTTVMTGPLIGVLTGHGRVETVKRLLNTVVIGVERA